MTDEQLRREALFLACMEFFQAMLGKAIITKEQYIEIEKHMAEKYRPPISVLSLTF